METEVIITKKINDKVMTMIISGAIVAGAGTYAFAAQYNQPVQQDTSIQAISSDTTSIDDIVSIAESVTSEEAIQSTVNSTESPSSAIQEVTNTDTAVQTIEDAKNAAVSEINQAKEQAVQEVQQATSSTIIQPTVKCDKTVIKFTVPNPDKQTQAITSNASGTVPMNMSDVISCDVNCFGDYIDDKYIIFSYGGHFQNDCFNIGGLVNKGLVIKDKSGNSITPVDNGFCSFKIPYSDISSLSTMYICMNNQQIEITVG